MAAPDPSVGDQPGHHHGAKTKTGKHEPHEPSLQQVSLDKGSKAPPNPCVTLLATKLEAPLNGDEQASVLKSNPETNDDWCSAHRVT